MTATTTIRTPKSATLFNGKVDRVIRNEWKVVDNPGKLQQIDKSRLNIDDSYQRPESKSKVQTMAASWSWVACGALTVAHRNGRYYVMDGGHRTMAAMSRSDIHNLPCIVFESEGMEEEARGFLASNTLARPVNALEKFKALIVTGDEAAIAVKQLVEKEEFTIPDYPTSAIGTVKCVGTLLRCWRIDSESLINVFPVIAQLCRDAYLHDRILASIWYIERRLRQSNSKFSLARNPHKDRLLRVGHEVIIEECAKATAYHAMGGPKIWASGVLKVLNYKTRNKIILDQMSDEENEEDTP